MKKILKSLNLFEIILWIISVITLIVLFALFAKDKFLYLVSSIIGVTALVFVSKGNPLGQLLTIIFSIFYSIISFSFRYYGEMITYLFMSAPMALFALIIWIKNSYNGNYLEVKVNVIKKKEWIFISMLSIIFSIVSYFILKAINNNSLFVSTLSILTSMLASYFTFRRSKYYAICYAFNDIVLIVLWVVACLSDISYIPIVMCFVFFLIYDLYGFFNWGKIYKKQNNLKKITQFF